MTTTSATDRRDDKARFLLASAGQWLRVRTKDGRPLAYGIPSATRPGLVHLANSNRCTARTASGGATATTAAPSRCTWRASAPSTLRGRWSPPHSCPERTTAGASASRLGRLFDTRRPPSKESDKCSLSLAPARTPASPLPISNSSTMAPATAGFAASSTPRSAMLTTSTRSSRAAWAGPSLSPSLRSALRSPIRPGLDRAAGSCPCHRPRPAAARILSVVDEHAAIGTRQPKHPW
jgi:hypothetical protein